jgi:hypothetical protein
MSGSPDKQKGIDSLPIPSTQRYFLDITGKEM